MYQRLTIVVSLVEESGAWALVIIVRRVFVVCPLVRLSLFCNSCTCFTPCQVGDAASA